VVVVGRVRFSVLASPLAASRRDLHRLFDQGLLAVGPDGTIDVAKSLAQYEFYSSLHGRRLTVGTTLIAYSGSG
jgi:hypothetical protein